jgi:hypothetical protein
MLHRRGSNPDLVYGLMQRLNHTMQDFQEPKLLSFFFFFKVKKKTRKEANIVLNDDTARYSRFLIILMDPLAYN